MTAQNLQQGCRLGPMIGPRAFHQSHCARQRPALTRQNPRCQICLSGLLFRHGGVVFPQSSARASKFRRVPLLARIPRVLSSATACGSEFDDRFVMRAYLASRLVLISFVVPR